MFHQFAKKKTILLEDDMEGKKSGFTLLQLIIVVIVIAVLAGVMIGTFVSVVRSAKEASAKQQAACEAMIKSNEDLIDVIKNSKPDSDAIAKAVADAVKDIPCCFVSYFLYLTMLFISLSDIIFFPRS